MNFASSFLKPNQTFSSVFNNGYIQYYLNIPMTTTKIHKNVLTKKTYKYSIIPAITVYVRQSGIVDHSRPLGITKNEDDKDNKAGYNKSGQQIRGEKVTKGVFVLSL